MPAGATWAAGVPSGKPQSKKDSQGNVLQGHVIAEGSRDCYLRSEHRLVVGLGVENLVVVEPTTPC